jgi:hypothetical protein
MTGRAINDRKPSRCRIAPDMGSELDIERGDPSVQLALFGSRILDQGASAISGRTKIQARPIRPS